ncbi:hypothetical protein [Solidesulfovibrio alcoholivorans]|uniref:hypothetical protein n=1 Tax=Solidesulfovibrio alcoholivorans TaxID=81406 RepID=UPI000497DB9C|nr:hypothetical protein [Solidesulfovibrio alcoholivorans]
MRRYFRAAALCVLLAVMIALPALAQRAADIAGNWSAVVLGQEITADFTRQGDMINGVVAIPDIGGGKNIYHVAGVILGADFAAQHGSGHLLKGTLTGPDTAEAVFSPKTGPSLTLHLKRRAGP